jgi:hypothetical protein
MTQMKTLLTLVFSISSFLLLSGQSFKESIEVDHSFSNMDKAVIIILNISGDLKVQEQPGKTMTGSVLHTIESENSSHIEKSKEDIQLHKEVKGDTLFYYLKTPCNPSLKYTSKNNWSYDWSEDCNWDKYYSYAYDFDLLVPTGTKLILSTINNGDILVDGASGPVHARNINGSVTVSSMKGSHVIASTINGDVSVQFDRNPIDSCRFYTLNGDINGFFQDGLSAVTKFKSFNGDFFTDAEKIETISTLKPVQSKNDHGIKYRINDGSVVRIGNGDMSVFLDFETFNGDAYLRTKKIQ